MNELAPAIYTARSVGTQKGRDGDMFTVTIGLDEAMVQQLKERSLDVSDREVQENTSDKKRFGEGLYEEWYAKDRVPFALVESKSGALAALVWFGPKPLGVKSMKHLSEAEQKKTSVQATDQWHTLAYRSYPPFRGKGLMKAFVGHAIDVYRDHFPEAKLWTIVDSRNAGSVALASKLGFTKVDAVSDESSTVMIKE